MSSENPYRPPDVPVDFPVSDDLDSIDRQYVPNAGRASTAIVFLYVTIAIESVSIIAGSCQIVVIDRIRSGVGVEQSSAEIADLFVSVANILQLIVLIGTAITFCLWFYRAYKNLYGLGIYAITYSPGWAPGSLFVPFLNLVRPYQIAKEIWISSDPGYVGGNPPNTDHQIVSLWWGFLLGSKIIGNVGARMSQTGDLGMYQSRVIVIMFSELLSIVAAFLAIKVIKTIEQRQTQRNDLLQREQAEASSL